MNQDDLTMNGLADDHSLRRPFNLNQTNSGNMSDEDSTITVIENSMQNIKSWMDAVRLKLNESKIELIYFGSHQQLPKCQHSSINIISETIDRYTQVKYLGQYLNCNLLFRSHINITCKAAINIIRIHNIWKYLTKDTCHTLILLLAISHLDYSNSLLVGLPEKSINLMQHVQNTLAKVILNGIPKTVPLGASRNYTGSLYNK